LSNQNGGTVSGIFLGYIILNLKFPILNTFFEEGIVINPAFLGRHNFLRTSQQMRFNLNVPFQCINLTLENDIMCRQINTSVKEQQFKYCHKWTSTLHSICLLKVFI